ncbi:MAG TPA: nucleotide exchange factor GrpE [Tepidisphaeraceae bacterium]|jgi:molecular chaperone GrpE
MSKTPFDDDGRDDDNDLGVQDTADLGAADEALAGSVSADEHQRLKDERDKLMYVVAEAQNMRKRLESEKEQAVQYANQSLIRTLIPIIDNFERALAVDPAKVDSASVLKGLQLVHDQLMKELEKQKVEVIDPRPGTPFDPTRHEALMQQDVPNAKPGTVAQALTKGYALHGRTLRPAGVTVAK